MKLTLVINGSVQVKDCLPCPHCGSDELWATDWWDDDGEYSAVECKKCKSAAPAEFWNKREGK